MCCRLGGVNCWAVLVGVFWGECPCIIACIIFYRQSAVDIGYDCSSLGECNVSNVEVTK